MKCVAVTSRGITCGDPADGRWVDVWLCHYHLLRAYRECAKEVRRLDRENQRQEEEAKEVARLARGGHDPIVYFVERDGFVKVGTTTNLGSRLKSLGRDETTIDGISRGPVDLLATMPGDREHERQLHVRFADCCVGGEWFLPNSEMLLLITRLQRRAGRTSAASLAAWNTITERTPGALAS